MGDFADIIRPYWAFDLNNIPVNKSITLKEWIGLGKNYTIYNPVSTRSFSLKVHERSDFLAPVSQDCNKFICASLESIIKEENTELLPKSVSWLLIKQYYAAFYAAHAIIRLVGVSLSQLDQSHISKIQNIADHYSMRNSVNIEKGYYKINYDNKAKELSFNKIEVNKDGGSHIVLWKEFGEILNKIADDFLRTNPNTKIQSTIVKLSELTQNLQYINSKNFSWLSRVRNDINYKFTSKTWFPYALDSKILDQIRRGKKQWREDIATIELKNLRGKELVRFTNTCQFIIGLLIEISEDMSSRCSKGKSFHTNGYSKILNFSQ